MMLPVEMLVFLAEMRADKRFAHVAEKLAAKLRALDLTADGNPNDARAFDDILQVLRRCRTIGAKFSAVGWFLYQSKTIAGG